MRSFCIFLIICAVSAQAHAQTLLWQKQPLKITLPVGKERIISFAEPTSLQIPLELNESVELAVLKNQHYYLKAKQSFAAQRVFATAANGEQFILDVSARQGAATSDIKILSEDSELEKRTTLAQSQTLAPKLSINDHYIRLTRFAAKQAYAPVRLLTKEPDLHRVKVVEHIKPLLRGTPEIAAVVLASWRSKDTGLYITIVELINRASYPVIIDIRQVRGKFLTAATQHGRLLAQDKENKHKTALYLISSTSFEEALGI